MCGVPQGSVPGPLLFLLYINDLFLSSNYLSFIIFADDTNIFLRHKDLATLTRMINQELSHVSSWFNANKLTVHPDKSKFIIFHPRRKQINPSELNILINNTPIAFLVRTITTRTLLDGTPTVTLTLRRSSTLALLRQRLYRTSEAPLKLLHVYYNLTIYVLHTNP